MLMKVRCEDENTKVLFERSVHIMFQIVIT